MTEREMMLFDHTLTKNREQLKESEVHNVSADLNFILQHLIKAVQNLDDRLTDLEMKSDE